MATQPSKPTTPYDADKLYQRLIAAIGAVPIILISGPVGSGKSTVLASAPIAKGKVRRVFDHEDSMPFVDAGKDGVDLYTPAHQKFRMERIAFPRLEDYAKLMAELKGGQHNIGAVSIDNIKLLQDQMIDALLTQAVQPGKVREFMAKFDAGRALPASNKKIEKWQQLPDAGFWESVKAPFKNLILLCKQQKVLLLGSTEEGNVWANYGGADQRVVGKKGKLLDVWLRYADAMIFLQRDVNKREPPKGAVNPHQTKMRLQGLNPTWVMDWPGFIAELEAAKQRSDEAIPEEAKVVVDTTTEAPETPPEPAKK